MSPSQRRVPLGPAVSPVETTQTPVPRPLSLDADQLATARLLVVDDDPGTLAGLVVLLSRYAGDVRTATRGDEAVELARAAPPDLVLLDLRLPDVDGLTVCRRLQQQPGQGDLPVLLLTAFDAEDLPEEVFAAGAIDYLRKPLRHRELLARIRLHLAARAANRLARDREHSWRLLLATSHDGVWVTDSRGHTVLVNDRLCDLLGFSPDTLLGRPVLDCVVQPPPDFEAWLEGGAPDDGAGHEGGRRGADRRTDTLELHRGDGQRRWARIAGSRIYGPQGVYQGALLSIADVDHAHRQAEELARAHRVDVAVRRLALELISKSVHDPRDYSVPEDTLAALERFRTDIEASRLRLDVSLDPQQPRLVLTLPAGAPADGPADDPPEAVEFPLQQGETRYGTLRLERPGQPWQPSERRGLRQLVDIIGALLARWSAERDAAWLRDSLHDQLSVNRELLGRRQLLLQIAGRIQATYLSGVAPTQLLQAIGLGLLQATGAVGGAWLPAPPGPSPAPPTQGGPSPTDPWPGLRFGQLSEPPPERLPAPPSGQEWHVDPAAPRWLGLALRCGGDDRPPGGFWLYGPRVDPWKPPLDDLGPVLQAIASVITGARAQGRQRAAEAAITEQRDALRVINRRLSHALDARRQLLALVSHELRTPMTSILGLSEALYNQAMGPLNPSQRGALDTVRYSGQHLLRLINDLIELSRAERADLSPLLRRVPLAEALQGCIRILEPIASAQRIQLQVGPIPADAVLWIEQRRFQQLVVNLASNAIKFSPAGGTVECNCHYLPRQPNRGAAWAIDILDRGPGIPDEALVECFQPFRRLEASDQQLTPGSGLGLAVVRKLLSQLGAGLEVGPRAGGGTRFQLRLPLPQASPTAPPTGPLPGRVAWLDLTEPPADAPPNAPWDWIELRDLPADQAPQGAPPELMVIHSDLVTPQALAAVTRWRDRWPRLPILLAHDIARLGDATLLQQHAVLGLSSPGPVPGLAASVAQLWRQAPVPPGAPPTLTPQP